MSDQWRTPFVDLRRHFAEKCPSVYHLLIEVERDVCEHEWGHNPRQFIERQVGLPPDCLWRRPRWTISREPMPVFLSTYEIPLLYFQRGYLAGEPFRIHTFYGDDREAYDRFEEMAARAVQCLGALPPSISEKLPDLGRLLPLHTSDGPSPVQFWLLLTHRLAWERTPISPLKASRVFWTRFKENNCYSIYDRGIENLMELADEEPSIAPEFIGGLPPKYWCSVLPADVFQSSTWAVDLILSMEAEGSETNFLGRATAPPATSPSLDDDRYITLRAAAKLTALSEGYLSKLCSEGRILTNGVKGRGRRLDAASVANFVDNR